MPTVILLDNSLSMCRNVTNHSDPTTTTRQISHQIIQRLVDHISQNEKTEHLALVAYSSTAQILSDFTTDYAKISDSVANLVPGDIACLEEGLNKVSDLVINEFACFTNIHILLITNDSEQLHANSVKTICQRLRDNQQILKDHCLANGIDYDQHIHFNSILNEEVLKTSLKYPFAFPNRLDIIYLAEFEPGSDSAFTKIDDASNKSEILAKFSETSVQFGFDEEAFQARKWQESRGRKLHALNELIELNNSSGSLYVTRVNGREKGEFDSFCEQIIVDLFRVYACHLKCGHLEASVNLVPAPLVYKG